MSAAHFSPLSPLPPRGRKARERGVSPAEEALDAVAHDRRRAAEARDAAWLEARGAVLHRWPCAALAHLVWHEFPAPVPGATCRCAERQAAGRAPTAEDAAFGVLLGLVAIRRLAVSGAQKEAA